MAPVWSANGEWVIFSSDRDGDPDLYKKRADQSGAAERILEREGWQEPLDIDAEGGRLLFEEARVPRGARDLYILDLAEGGDVEPVATSDLDEFNGRFSPDGRFVAFASNDTGIPEIYVLDLESGVREIASSGGGNTVFWSADGSKLYSSFRGNMSEVPVQFEPVLRLDPPALLFPHAPPAMSDFNAVGERFLRTLLTTVADAADVPAYRIDVVIHWFRKLEELAPTGGSR